MKNNYLVEHILDPFMNFTLEIMYSGGGDWQMPVKILPCRNFFVDGN